MFEPEKSIFDTIISPLITFLTGKYIIGKSSVAEENADFARDIAKLRNKNTEIQEKLLVWKFKYSNIPGLLKAPLPAPSVKKIDYKPIASNLHNRSKVWGGALSTGIVTVITLRLAIKNSKISTPVARVIGATIAAFLISIVSEYSSTESDNL